MRAFCTSEGIFSFNDVPAGSHLLHVDLMGVAFPEVSQPAVRTGGTGRTEEQAGRNGSAGETGRT